MSDEFEDEFDDDGWCVDCSDDHGDVLDDDEWLCKECLLVRYFKLHEEVKSLRNSFAWTKQRPTEPGWYFTRRKGSNTHMDCDYYDTNDLSVSPTFYNDWEFAGPYPEPKEASNG